MFKDLLLLTLLTLLTKWKSCFWNLLHKCSKTNCYWGYWHCWHHIIQKNHIFPLVFCCCWQCWQQRNLVFEKCLKDVQRLTAVDAVDTVDNMEILFLKYGSKMFKDLLLLTPLTLLTSQNSEKTHFLFLSFTVDAVDTVDNKEILLLNYA